jgi:MOSC domain-containing protein YiiM
VDFDLSEVNLKSGDRLQIGKTVIKVTAVPHTGCGLFKARFRADSLAVINSDLGKSLHLRGIYARVVMDGVVKVGDRAHKN